MRKKFLVPIGITLFYLISHVMSLTLLPVFADESIYIRWAQLLMDDWHQYLFFALNDGKTPLFIWSLVPFQFLFQDQLYAARFVAVLVGFFQMFVIAQIVKQLGGRQKAQWLSMFLVAILPFWFLYHRFALMDGMLTLFLSLTVWGTIRIVQNKDKQARKLAVWVAVTGISLGLALWSKLPALFIVPALPFFVFLTEKIPKPKLVKQLIAIGVSIFIGGLIFVLLRISPAFGQLFRRSSDFTFPIGEVLFQGKWKETLPNIPNYLFYFWQYLSWPIVILSLAGLFSKRNRKVTAIMFVLIASLSGVFFLFGRVVFTRYFLPVAIPFTVLACLNAQTLFDKYFTLEPRLPRKMLAAAVITLLFGTVVSQSFQFIFPALSDPNTIPFVSSDRDQYLTTWSSGTGIPETVAYIMKQSQDHTIAVATEGRFGTLPDGLTLYFHNRDVRNIYIEGTGQFPVSSLPEFFKERARKFDQVILVVNSDRMQVKLPDTALIAQYCRPFNATCLQIWDVTSLVK